MNRVLHVLVVDDSPSIRRLTVQALESAGLRATACEGALEALAQAARESFDAVVTDLNMPDLDGLTLTRRLRALPQMARCPILILTTEGSATRKQEARDAGASGWILKPFSADTLVYAIQKVSQRSELAT